VEGSGIVVKVTSLSIGVNEIVLGDLPEAEPGNARFTASHDVVENQDKSDAE
jgi:hypothetical protein